MLRNTKLHAWLRLTALEDVGLGLEIGQRQTRDFLEIKHIFTIKKITKVKKQFQFIVSSFSHP